MSAVSFVPFWIELTCFRPHAGHQRGCFWLADSSHFQPRKSSRRHSGAIGTVSVSLMNSSFLSMVSKAPRKVSVGISRAMSLDPVGTLQDGGFESELIFVDLVWQGGEKV